MSRSEREGAPLNDASNEGHSERPRPLPATVSKILRNHPANVSRQMPRTQISVLEPTLVVGSSTQKKRD